MKLDKQKTRKRFPKLKNDALFLLIFGMGLIATAIAEYVTSIPYTNWGGKWAWVYRWAVETFGTNGSVYLWLAFGTLCICKAFMNSE